MTMADSLAMPIWTIVTVFAVHPLLSVKSFYKVESNYNRHIHLGIHGM